MCFEYVIVLIIWTKSSLLCVLLIFYSSKVLFFIKVYLYSKFGYYSFLKIFFTQQYQNFVSVQMIFLLLFDGFNKVNWINIYKVNYLNTVSLVFFIYLVINGFESLPLKISFYYSYMCQYLYIFHNIYPSITFFGI